jgi:hypothetical protein
MWELASPLLPTAKALGPKCPRLPGEHAAYQLLLVGEHPIVRVAPPSARGARTYRADFVATGNDFEIKSVSK